jgi:two-component system chemotaxis sensor kinase CheA
VGLDVVRRNIERVRGQIDVQSRPGLGTTVTIRLPLTLAVIPGFVVGVDAQTFVLPITVVDECLELPRGVQSGTTGIVHVRGEGVPVVRLRRFFGFGDETYPREVMVLVEYQQGRAGLIVDEVFGEAQTLIKPLGPMLRNMPGVTGTAVMGSGAVAMVLDPAAIFRLLEKNAADVA